MYDPNNMTVGNMYDPDCVIHVSSCINIQYTLSLSQYSLWSRWACKSTTYSAHVPSESSYSGVFTKIGCLDKMDVKSWCDLCLKRKLAFSCHVCVVILSLLSLFGFKCKLGLWFPIYNKSKIMKWLLLGHFHCCGRDI